MKVVFHPEAYDEMLESARFFNDKNPGLGADLINAVQDATRRLANFPKYGPVEHASIRKCLVRGFPFAILYEVLNDRIFIAAVMHQHRRPYYWRHRIRQNL